MTDDFAADRWLLFIMQLPTRPAAPRIKLWRRLQQLGSIALRGSVYVLPHTAQAREDFEWLRGEVVAAGGQASILAAHTLTAEEHASIQQAFRDARSQDYRSLAAALNHSAFNLANALGAWLGGVAISAGLGWTSTGWVGALLAVVGLGVFALALRADRR